MNRKLLINLSFNAIVGVLIAAVSGFNALACIALVNVAGLAMHAVKNATPGFTLFDGLAAEVWIPLVMEDPYPNAAFIQEATDMSALVEYDTINFAEAGADPTVLKNNTNYPIAMTEPADTPKSIVLDYYDTTSSVVRNAVLIELAYDQRLLYANKHKKALAKKIGMDAAYAYSPQTNDSTKQNTVLNLGSGDSVIDAFIDMQTAYNNVDDDGTERIGVITPTHLAMIAKEDKTLYKTMIAKPGDTYFGFKLYQYSKNPIYIGSTGAKAAQGAAYVSGTHKYSSFFFLKSEVMRADGTLDMFSKLKDPDQKGDVFNFQKRALVGSLRGKYMGAILK